MRRLPPYLLSLSIAAFACLLTASSASAQTPWLNVERSGDAVIQALPGDLVRAVFVLTNKSVREVEVETDAMLPIGWEWIAAPSTVRLEANSSVVHVIAVRIPADASPGRHTIRYDAVVGSVPGTQSGDTVVISVAERHALSLEALGSPSFVEAGANYESRFLLRSRGNTPVRVQLHLAGHGPFKASIDSSSVVLEPGETRVVNVAVATDAELRRTIRHVLRVRAEVAGDTAFATSMVEVVPSGGSDVVRRTLPVQLALRGAWPHGSAPPVELSGSGALTPDGSTWLKFLLRGPDPAPSSIFGERDEYLLELHGRTFAFHLGDRFFNSELLTQPGRYGFGAIGRIEWSGLEVGGSTLLDRRTGFYPPWHGGFIGYRSGGSGIRVRYDRTESGVRRETWTGLAVLEPIRGLSLQAEYGSGDRTAGGPRPDAYAVRLSAVHRRVAVNARHTRVDPDYPGRYQGVSEDFGSITLRPWGKLELGTWMNRSDHNAGSSIPRGNHIFQASLAYGGRAALQLQASRRYMDIPTASYDLRQRSARLRIGQQILGVWLRPVAEVGLTDDLIGGGTSPFHRYSLRAEVHGSSMTASTWVERFSGVTSGPTLQQAWVSTGINASLRLSATTRLRLSVSGRRYDYTGRWGTTVVDIGFDQGLALGRLSTRARSVAYGAHWADARTDALVEYTIPFAVPIPGRATTGVAARIYDAETGQPMAGIPTRLGQSVALTDKQGRVTFGDVPPGTHYITLDQLSAGITRVTITDLPLPVQVVAGEKTTVRIGLVRGAHLSGTVRQYSFAEPARLGTARELVEAGGMARVLVVASKGDVVRRQVTDAQGRFDFGYLPPGRWTLEISAADLPAHHDLQPSRTVLDLAPGETENVDLRVVPRHREVRIVDRGEVHIDGTAGKAAATGRLTTATRIPIRRYTVELGDIGLMQIARAVYNDASLWPKIWVANQAQVPNPDLIRVGQMLSIPPNEPLTFTELRVRAEYYNGRASLPQRYTVGLDDFSLMQVARKIYDDASLWPKIWVANRTELPDPDIIRSGQVLKIPARAPLTAEEKKARDEYGKRAH